MTVHASLGPSDSDRPLVDPRLPPDPPHRGPAAASDSESESESQLELATVTAPGRRSPVSVPVPGLHVRCL